jgi:hypothetical protein
MINGRLSFRVGVFPPVGGDKLLLQSIGVREKTPYGLITNSPKISIHDSETRSFLLIFI